MEFSGDAASRREIIIESNLVANSKTLPRLASLDPRSMIKCASTRKLCDSTMTRASAESEAENVKLSPKVLGWSGGRALRWLRGD